MRSARGRGVAASALFPNHQPGGASPGHHTSSNPANLASSQSARTPATARHVLLAWGAKAQALRIGRFGQRKLGSRLTSASLHLVFLVFARRMGQQMAEHRMLHCQPQASRFPGTKAARGEMVEGGTVASLLSKHRQKERGAPQRASSATPQCQSDSTVWTAAERQRLLQ